MKFDGVMCIKNDMVVVLILLKNPSEDHCDIISDGILHRQFKRLISHYNKE